MHLRISSSSIKHVDISEYLWVSSLGKLFGPVCQGSLDSFAEAFYLVITKSQPHHPCYNKSFCIMLSSPLQECLLGRLRISRWEHQHLLEPFHSSLATGKSV